LTFSEMAPGAAMVGRMVLPESCAQNVELAQKERSACVLDLLVELLEVRWRVHVGQRTRGVAGNFADQRGSISRELV